jgi:hypothetical protein
MRLTDGFSNWRIGRQLDRRSRDMPVQRRLDIHDQVAEMVDTLMVESPDVVGLGWIESIQAIRKVKREEREIAQAKRRMAARRIKMVHLYPESEWPQEFVPRRDPDTLGIMDQTRPTIEPAPDIPDFVLLAGRAAMQLVPRHRATQVRNMTGRPATEL